MEDVKKQPKNIYVDIDTLFDTRLPLLYMFNNDIAVRMRSTGKYDKRIKDEFETISYDIFRAFYRSRDKQLLKLALPTRIIGMIRKHYGEELTGLNDITISERPTLFINTYPYSLDLEEKEIFSIVIMALIPDCKIDFINVDNAELTPLWIDEHIGIMFKYDALDWIDYHVGTCSLINTPLLNVSLFAPALLTGTMKQSAAKYETFMNMAYAVGTVIDLSFIDAAHFSVDFSRKKKS